MHFHASINVFIMEKPLLFTLTYILFAPDKEGFPFVLPTQATADFYRYKHGGK